MNKHKYCSKWQILCVSASFIAMIAAGIYLQPGFSAPSSRVMGDEEIVAFLGPLLKGARGNVSAALITPDSVRYGIWGGDYAKQFEVASLTKTMTASLLMEAIQRGEVTAHVRVGDLVPEIRGPAKDILIEELVSHRSGLPALAASLPQKFEIIRAIILRKNIWNYDQTALINMVNQASLQKMGTFEYSNTGYALLGLALERAAGEPFATLITQRVFNPANMINSVVVEDNTPPDRAFSPGRSVSGFPESPWTQHAFSPTAGVRATIADMAKYTQALMENKLAGAQGMQPMFATDDPDSRIGYAWFTTRIKGIDITWHDGESAGFSSVIAFDRQRNNAVVILSDTAWPVIVPAMKLLLAQASSLEERQHELD